MQEPWSTIQQAAEHYAVSQRTIRNWIRSGRVEAKRVGPRLIRIRLDSLENLGSELNAGGAA